MKHVRNLKTVIAARAENPAAGIVHRAGVPRNDTQSGTASFRAITDSLIDSSGEFMIPVHLPSDRFHFNLTVMAIQSNEHLAEAPN
jgi:hypothetical protein